MGYFETIGVDLKNELKFIRKKKDAPLQPLYEAITNSLEAIAERFGDSNIASGRIVVSFEFEKSTLQIDPPVINFKSIRIKDNGIGFGEKGIKRLKNLRNADKGRLNKGTGRVQFIHYFKETNIESYNLGTSDDPQVHLKAQLSKSDRFLAHNSILWLEISDSAGAGNEIGAEVCFSSPIDPKDAQYYQTLPLEELRQEIIKHFLAYLCDQRENLPSLILQRVVDGECKCQLSISKNDVPAPRQDEPIKVAYSRMGDGNKVVDVGRDEEFRIRGFSLGVEYLPKNEILLVSKGQSGSSLALQDLGLTDVVDDKRYLFLLSGDYLDAHDTDERGKFNILTEKEFKSGQRDLDETEVVLIDRIEAAANIKVRERFPEIAAIRIEKDKSVDQLAAMFFLKKEAIDKVRGKIKNTDSDEQILRRIYEVDVEMSARKDAELKQIIDDLNKLDPTGDTYQEDVSKQSTRLTEIVPLQNRSILSQYVARRKIILEVFSKILSKRLDTVREKGRIDEDVLHNLIFRQRSDDPSSSDLWLMNEEFIYFNGVSEHELQELVYKGESILKEAYSDEETRFLESNKSKKLAKRPDILLFPEDGKCLLIEFKAPDVDVSQHLSQIDFYATLLLNFSKEKFALNKFYGYLIGETIEPNDVRGHDSDYVEAARFDYLYRPGHKVPGLFGRRDGTIYSEVLKYSTLLQRAMLRNKVFIEKLGLATEREK